MFLSKVLTGSFSVDYVWIVAFIVDVNTLL